MIHTFVSSNCHCNSLLYGLPAYKLNRLKLLQLTAARIVTLTRKFDHIPPVLYSLVRWLPTNQRIIFKILLLDKCTKDLMVNRLLTSQNCLITGPIIDHLGLLRRIILRLVRPTIDRKVIGLFHRRPKALEWPSFRGQTVCKWKCF